MDSIRVGIIGTAGRKEDRQRLTKGMYKNMLSEARWLIDSIRQGRDVYLVSGGAAWADHVAVNLFQEGFVNRLYLCLPAEWDHTVGRYVDNEEINWRLNPGGTANYYHFGFTSEVEQDSLAEIDHVLLNGAKRVVGNGFHDRNSIIAKADYMFAMTFGKGRILKDGGTADTMKQFLKTHDSSCGYHLDLTTFTTYQNPMINGENELNPRRSQERHQRPAHTDHTFFHHDSDDH